MQMNADDVKREIVDVVVGGQVGRQDAGEWPQHEVDGPVKPNAVPGKLPRTKRASTPSHPCFNQSSNGNENKPERLREKTQEGTPKKI